MRLQVTLVSPRPRPLLINFINRPCGPWPSGRALVKPAPVPACQLYPQVGSEVARRAKGLGMTVIAYDPYASQVRSDMCTARGLSLYGSVRHYGTQAQVPECM